MVNDSLEVQVLHVGEEKNKVICIDNFLSDPHRLVSFAKTSTFVPYAAAAQRKGYPGVRASAPAEFGIELRKRVADIVKSEYEIAEGSSIKPLQDALCMMTVAERELGPLQRIPHFDASSSYFFATLLFLCGEQHGGTGFYRHNSTGYETITPDRAEHYLDVSYEELNNKGIERRYFSESNDLFTKVGFVPAAFNRLLIYRGNILHSANILSDVSLNPDPAAGRLTANIFFSCE